MKTNARRRFLQECSLVCAGIVVSVFLFFTVRNEETARIEADFRHSAGNCVNSIKQSIDFRMGDVRILSALWNDDGEANLRQFHELASQLLQGKTSMQALEWIPRVEGKDRAAFEASVQGMPADDPALLKLLPAFRISERNSSGQLVPAGTRDQYYPVTYVEPVAGNEAALGFDLGSNETRRNAILKAWKTGQMVATARIKLVQEKGLQYGVLMFYPVMAPGTDNAGPGRGFVLGVFRIGDLIDSSVRQVSTEGVNLIVYDRQAPESESFLHAHIAGADDSITNSVALRRLWSAGLNYSDVLDVADRQWGLIFSPQPGFVSSRRTWMPESVMLLGLLLTAVITLLFRMMSRHAEKVEDVVKERTGELDRTNETLRQEIERRKTVEDDLQKSAAALESKIEERTRELTASREAAIVMMQDALDAGKRIESSNEQMRAEIAERKKIEDRLSLIQSAVDDASNAIVVCSDNRAVIYENMAFAYLFEMTLEAMQESSLESLFADPVAARAKIDDVFGGTNWHEELDMISKSGRRIPVAVSASLILNEKYAVVGISMVITDLTERKRAEAEAKRMQTQLLHSQKMQSVGSLASGIAHEINTPIQFVGDNTRFLRDCFNDLLSTFENVTAYVSRGTFCSAGEEGTAEITAMLAKADFDYLKTEIPKAIDQTLEGVQRVANIVRAMKEFSHPDTEGQKVLTDINRAIETTVTVAKNEWKYVAEVKTELEPSLPLVACMPGDVNQVFLNLIVNAAHAIADKNGSSGERGLITIKSRAAGDKVEIAVSDTGIGIPPENRQRIFEPFFTTKEVGRGTGQGLTIAYNVVVGKHGGALTFESEPGKGTTFTVRLPVAEKAGSMEKI